MKMDYRMMWRACPLQRDGCRLKRLQAAVLPQYGSYVQRGSVMVGVGERVEQAEKERVAHEGPAMWGTHGLDIGHIVL